MRKIGLSECITWFIKNKFNDLFIILIKFQKGGDSDSTGTIACAWYGALYGLSKVPKINYENSENFLSIA